MSDSEDLEKKWAEIREPERNLSYWLMPMALLYSGFFGGPFFTLIVAALVTRLRLEGRWSLFLIGFSGVTWCVLQAFTAISLRVYDPYVIYVFRSGVNLGLGVISFLVVRHWSKGLGYYSSRKTIIVTIVFALLCGLFFLMPSQKIMMAIGR